MTFIPAHYDEGWEYQPDLCPADDDFIEWLDRSDLMHIIFQMGPGLHHKVGQYTAPKGMRTLSYTICPAEMETYAQLPLTTRMVYHCYHRDVNDMLSVMNLTYFDAIYLPHLGEYSYPQDSTPDYLHTIVDFRNHLYPDGVLVAYTKSSAADRIISIFDKLYPTHEDFRSLRIYHPN